MMRIMDSMWKKQAMDFRMQLYRCVATADNVGMIEVVLNSETTANIAKAQGGASAVLADSTVTDWLRGFNKGEDEWEKCVETFMLSCAGYCVATYVLGIGDRHSDNIMISRKGHLFHIDFGHFLGNFKSKLGVKRERAPFKFTPQFAHVFGGKESPKYKKFEEISSMAYNMLRRNSDLFISLFGLMLSTGIPELQSVEDISYLRRAFCLDPDLDDVAAGEKFRKQIDKALHATSQTINDMFHHWMHR
jgi:phosphatidylinositol kinase/protein kinase (PI-3  family)